MRTTGSTSSTTGASAATTAKPRPGSPVGASTEHLGRLSLRRDNYAPGDRIFLFGYSRGAYTVRALCGLINNCGIIKRADARLIAAAWRIYKSSEREHHPDANLLMGRGVHLSVNTWCLGAAPLVEDGSLRSEPAWLAHAGLAYHYGRLEFGLEMFNLLDSDGNDIAYFYAFRLPLEPASGIPETHFQPLEPRTVCARVAIHW